MRRGHRRTWLAEAADWCRAARDMASAGLSVLRRHLAADGASGPSPRPAPVIIIPGVLEPWRYLLPLGRHLQQQGHAVHYVKRLGFNLRPFDASADEVLRLAAAEELEGAVIVGHSKGGIIGKLALLRDDERRLSGMVTVATPFAGSGLAAPLQRLPWAGRTPLADLFIGSEQLALIAAETRVNARITSLAPKWDQVVDRESTRLPGARLIDLERGGHFAPMRDESVWRIIAGEIRRLAST